MRVYRLITYSKVEENILNKATQKKFIDEIVIRAGSYDNKATDVERNKRLEDLLFKADNDDEVADDSVYTDE